MRGIFAPVMAKDLKLVTIGCSHTHLEVVLGGGWREDGVGGCVFSLKHHNPVLYGSWQFSGIVTQGQTAKNRGVVHDSCYSGEGRREVGGGVCACVGGDSENESCRIRFGSETREESAKRRVLQAAGRFITCCSLYRSPVSLNISRPPSLQKWW